MVHPDNIQSRKGISAAVTGRLVAGMVVGWSPSSADFASGMKETLDKSPESSGSDYSPSPITAKEVESGSSMGDDEDDF